MGRISERALMEKKDELVLVSTDIEKAEISSRLNSPERDINRVWYNT